MLIYAEGRQVLLLRTLAENTIGCSAIPARPVLACKEAAAVCNTACAISGRRPARSPLVCSAAQRTACPPAHVYNGTRLYSVLRN